MSAPKNRRIDKELRDMTVKALPGIKVDDETFTNIHEWKLIMDGPPNTPYAGGKFTLALSLPTDYPFHAPTIHFRTKIFHPNVTADDKGAMCLGILKTEQWKPSSQISSILEAAQQLLVEPNPDDAVEERAGNMYRNERGEFEKVAREWTERYAKA